MTRNACVASPIPRPNYREYLGRGCSGHASRLGRGWISSCRNSAQNARIRIIQPRETITEQERAENL
jgi:hypothetical protein